jgi:progesterone-induced-blocking factor 1
MFLREAKEEIEIKRDNAEAQLKEKQYAYDQLLLDYRTLQRRIESDLSELRIQLRLKSEELERVQNIYEDNLANLKATRHENEMLREKINVLKSEYYRSQVDAKEEMTGIKAQLEVAREQLANYEGIEHEIDQAIMKSAIDDHDGANPLLSVMG